MILQTSLAIGSAKFIGIMSRVHYTNNQFNLNFQPISLHFENNLMIWYTYSQLHKINFTNCITLFHKEWHIMYKILLIWRPCMEALSNNWMLQQPNIALQTRFALYSCNKYSSHNQIHNHITLSNPRDCALHNIRFVSLASMCNNERPTKNERQGQRIPGQHMKEKRWLLLIWASNDVFDTVSAFNKTKKWCISNVQGEENSVPGDIWASSVRILVFPSPLGDML
jgi:hypothetical protein